MTQPARRSTVSQDTPEQIILSAERLFGKFGIDAVSMRQINVAARQRNSSATHYHFGTKEALIAATFDYRVERINRRRLQRLDEVSKAGQFGDVRILVQVIILPIVEEIEQSKGGSHYIRFAGQAFGHPRLDFFSMRRSEFSEGMQRIYGLLKAALPDVPEILFGQRFGMVIESIFHSLADREIFRLSAKKKKKDFNAAAFLNNLVDSCTSVISAPVSAETQLAIDQQA
jgi:AcrR family transcriptional regulator